MSRWVGLVLVALVVACQSDPTLGATCERNSGCASPLVCRFARCRSECVAQRDCPVGTTCLLDQDGLGSCALPDDPDCDRTGCEAPLACVGRACVNVCSVGVECPSGSSCVPIGDGRARCVRIDGNDAGFLEASVVDAFTPDDAGPHDAARLDAGRCTPGSGPAGPCDTPIEVAVGDSFSCVRAQSGLIWCWGTGRSIGRDGDMTECTTIDVQNFACPYPEPLRFEDASGNVGTTPLTDQLDAHDTGGCFTTHPGAIACWGTSGYEAPLGRDIQMGERARLVTDGTGTPIDLVDRFVLFDGTAIALRFGDHLWWGWGTDTGNVLGLATATRTPTAISIGTPLVDDMRTIATGLSHACGLVAGTAENVVCWGSNDHGESNPGHVDTGGIGRTPIPGVTNATQLVMGRTHSCALADGGLVCWGARANLYLDHDVPGCASTQTDCGPTVIPTVTSSGHTVVIAHLFPSRNSEDFCASEANGTLYCWGEGYGCFDSHPALVPNLPPVGSAVITWTHGCAIDTNSQVWCWGRNESGELARLPLESDGQLPAMPVAW